MNRIHDSRLELEKKRFGSNPDDLFVAGSLLLNKGNFKEARQKFKMAMLYNPRLSSKIALCYENILENDSDNINARLSLADHNLMHGDLDDAICELEEILDISPDRPEVYTMLGKLYLKSQEYDKAIEVIETAISAGIMDTSLAEMLAGAYVEMSRIEDAITLYEQLLKTNPFNKNYLRVLADIYSRVNRFEMAAISLHRMIEDDITMLGEVMYKLEEVKKRSPENTKIKEFMADVYMKALKPALAVNELNEMLLLDAGGADKIIKKFKEILGRYPDEPTTLNALAHALTLKAAYSEAVAVYIKLMKYSQEHVDGAIEGLREILRLFPGQVHARESLGDAYLKQGRTEEALLEYLEVLKLDQSAAKNIIDKCQKILKDNTNSVLPHHVLGKAYLLSGDTLLAIEEAEFMIYLDKNNAPANELMGDAYMKTGNFQKAQTFYSAAITLDPYQKDYHGKYEAACLNVLKIDIGVLKGRIDEDPWRIGTHLDIAKLYLISQDFEKGIKELQTAVKDSARAPFAFNLLGLTFIEGGRFDLAQMQFERALDSLTKELSDVAKSIRFNLGATHEAQGNVAEALEQYELILTEDMEFEGLQARCKRLGGINPEALRNKHICAVIEKLNSKTIIGMWGQDLRHNETTNEILNISFGQDHNNAGMEHFIKGRYKGASEEFSLAVQLDPRIISSINNLAVMLMMEGHLEQAQTRLILSLTMDPGSAVIHNNLGVQHYLKGDLELARSHFAKALEIDPNLSAAIINIADILYIKGDVQSAIKYWEKVKVNDTLSPLAVRRLTYKTVKA